MSLVAYADKGAFAPQKMAAALCTTTEELAASAGLGRDAVQRKERIHSVKTQKSLRQMAEIIAKAAPRFGSDLLAYAWYRSEPLAGFCGFTAMQMVKAGRADEVLAYIDAIDAGIHA